MVQPVIIDVTDDSFEVEVLSQSHNRLVVVDFWASWCGPCQMLKPVLENLAREYEGAFLLAKLNTEENFVTPQQYRVQGIPDVKFFQNGAVVDGFVGVQGERHIRQLLAKYVLREEDRLILELEALAERQPAEALTKLQTSSLPDSSRKKMLEAKLLLHFQRYDDATEVLKRITVGEEGYFQAQNLMVLGALEHFVQQCAEEDPQCLRMRGALEALNERRPEDCLDLLLEILFRDKEYAEGLARKVFLAVESFLEDASLRKRYQRQLSMAVNS
jgi:putative thioredoxin